MTQAIQLTLMTVEEARTCIDQIKTNLETVRERLTDLHDREGWRALEYPTWQACIQAEFHMSDRRAHQLLNAHVVDKILAPPWRESTAFFGKNATDTRDRTIVHPQIPVAPIPEAQARELEPIVADHEAVREVYREAVERTNGRPTAASIREVVDERLGIERPERIPAESPPAPSIDAVADEQDDDGAVAAARLNAQYSSGIAAALKLTFLDARAVVGLLGRDRRLVHGENARMLRRWLDAVDIELRAAEAQPLRMVGGMHG